jgi:hypothetical protein
MHKCSSILNQIPSFLECLILKNALSLLKAEAANLLWINIDTFQSTFNKGGCGGITKDIYLINPCYLSSLKPVFAN